MNYIIYLNKKRKGILNIYKKDNKRNNFKIKEILSGESKKILTNI